MNIQRKLSTARWILSRHGLDGFVVYLLRIIFWRGRDDKSRGIFLFILDTPKITSESIKAAKEHTFRFATLEDIYTYRAEPLWEIGQTSLLAFERGDRCLLQFDGDTLVGYTWITTSPLVEIIWGFHFNMPDNTVCNYKGFTAPAYRGKGFQSLRHLKLFEYIKSTGQQRLFAYVDQMNLNSLKGLKKSGYKKIGVLRCVEKKGKVQFALNVSTDFCCKERRS